MNPISVLMTKWWSNSDTDLLNQYSVISLLLADDEDNIIYENTINNIMAIEKAISNSPQGSKWKITYSLEGEDTNSYYQESESLDVINTFISNVSKLEPLHSESIYSNKEFEMF